MGTMLATRCLRLDMTYTAKNITKNDDVEIKRYVTRAIYT